MRKSIEVVIMDDGEEKHFLITRMSAKATEDWALELFFALANTGVEVPKEFEELGFAAIAQMGLSALGKIPYEKAKPLLDRMMDCVQIYPTPSDKRIVRALTDEDIQEVTTRLQLKKEVFNLHTDFLKAANP